MQLLQPEINLMDLEDFRTLLHTTDVDLWDLIDGALSAAACDHPTEFRRRSDGIVRHINSLATFHEEKPPQVATISDDENDIRCKILAIKTYLDNPDVVKDKVSLVGFLRNLDDMDVSVDALTETLIGRSVNRLRKYPCEEVRSLVTSLIRKWKNLVSMSLCSGEEKLAEVQITPAPSSSIPQEVKKPDQEGSIPDPNKLASATKRLHQNYKAAENAKKARTIKIIEIHEIPKRTNCFVPKNKQRTDVSLPKNKRSRRY